MSSAETAPIEEQTCDVAVIGGSLGGFSALGPLGDDVLLFSDTRWPGGQITSQGVPALDEHAHIETFGAPRSYHQMREAVRLYYQGTYNLPYTMRTSVLGENLPLNPGNCWVSRLAFSGDVFQPRLFDHTWTAVDADVDGDTVQSITLERDDGQRVRVQARYFLDATDTGDLLPLTGTAYVTGAEAQSDTGEPSAPAEARPGETQGFTYTFAVEFCPGEDHTIAPPQGYEHFRDHQPYTLAPVGRDGQPVVYKMFETSESGNLPFWTYRRLHDGNLLGGNDISLINWISNDYHGGNIIDASAEDRTRYLGEAKRLALGFLYWLQTECPRDDGGVGYPELKLRPDLMHTDDGLSMTPYIRESRRVVPVERVVEQDISAAHQPGARARHHTNSVGLGWYALDLHPCVGNPSASMYAPTRPFQIPLGALLPQQTRNLIAACKNIGTTHLTNGAYRVHPAEWAVGEAAGTLAAFCVRHDVTPHQVHADDWLTWRLQYALVSRGCPVFWAVDVPVDHPLFLPTQLLLVRGVIVPGSARWHRLDVRPGEPLGDDIDLAHLGHLADRLNRQAGRTVIDLARFHADLPWSAVCEVFHEPLVEALR
jgi:hypothetical protein